MVLALRRGAAPPAVSAAERCVNDSMPIAAAKGRPGTRPAHSTRRGLFPLLLPATGCRSRADLN